MLGPNATYIPLTGVGVWRRGLASGFGVGVWRRGLASGFGVGVWRRGLASGFGVGVWRRGLTSGFGVGAYTNFRFGVGGSALGVWRRGFGVGGLASGVWRRVTQIFTFFSQRKILASGALPNASPRRQVFCALVEYRLYCINRTLGGK